MQLKFILWVYFLFMPKFRKRTYQLSPQYRSCQSILCLHFIFAPYYMLIECIFNDVVMWGLRRIPFIRMWSKRTEDSFKILPESPTFVKCHVDFWFLIYQHTFQSCSQQKLVKLKFSITHTFFRKTHVPLATWKCSFRAIICLVQLGQKPRNLFEV